MTLLRYSEAAEGAAHTGSNEGHSGETRARWLTKGPHPLSLTQTLQGPGEREDTLLRVGEAHTAIPPHT